MISHIIEQQQAISAVLSEDHTNWHKLLTHEGNWVIEELYTVIEPFPYLTDALSGEKSVMVSAIQPVTKDIVDALTVRKDSDSKFIKEVKQKINNDITNQYDDDGIQQLLDKSAFLDPRFKKCMPNYDKTVEMIQEEALAGPVLEEPNNDNSTTNKNEGFGSWVEPHC